jgi:hypothetical protein
LLEPLWAILEDVVSWDEGMIDYVAFQVVKINQLGTDKGTVLDGGDDDELDIKRFREFLLYTRRSEHHGFIW